MKDGRGVGRGDEGEGGWGDGISDLMEVGVGGWMLWWRCFAAFSLRF